MSKNIDLLINKYAGIEHERFFKEAFEQQVYKDVLNRKMDVVVDLGALAGEFSAFVYDYAKKIYAIEMFSGAYKELSDNVREFKLSKIKPYHLAIGVKAGKKKIRTNEVVRGGHRLEEGDENETVTVKTLKQFMEGEGIDHIDVLKIDVEGIEEDLFRSDDFKEIAPKIDYIIGEHAGTKELKELGYEVKSLGPVWTATRI